MRFIRARCDVTYCSLASVKIALLATSKHNSELIVGVARDQGLKNVSLCNQKA